MSSRPEPQRSRSWLVLGWVLVALTAFSALQKINRTTKASAREASYQGLDEDLATVKEAVIVLRNELDTTRSTSVQLRARLQKAESELEETLQTLRRLRNRAGNLSWRLYVRNSPPSASSPYEDLPPGVDPWGDLGDYYEPDPCADYGECGYEEEAEVSPPPFDYGY